jgi:subtilisin family serine protease
MTTTLTTAAALLILSLGTPVIAQDTTYRVVVALKASTEAEIASAQRRASKVLGAGLGRVSQTYSTIPAFAAVVTREGWTTLGAQPDVESISLDEAAEIESIRAKTTSPARALSIDKMGLSGKGVTIALVDTGVDTTHRDLSGVVIDEACFCLDASGAPCCPDGSSMQVGTGSAQDDNGHGTHLAGIIAGHGKTKGLAPKAHIVSIKIASSTGSTSVWSMLAALDWLATSRPNVQVVNMSLGTTATYTGACDTTSSVTSSLAAAGQTLTNRGVLLVAAAGNSGLTDKMSAPACISGFLSVGAVYSQAEQTESSNGCIDQKTAADHVACFSNSSSALALLAPGASIVSTSLHGGQAIGSGTSQAAAVVSGAAALLMERAGGAGAQVDAALRGNGVFITDNRNGRVTPRIDTSRAAAALGGL